jgi:hypothetical protein
MWGGFRGRPRARKAGPLPDGSHFTTAWGRLTVPSQCPGAFLQCAAKQWSPCSPPDGQQKPSPCLDIHGKLSSALCFCHRGLRTCSWQPEATEVRQRHNLAFPNILTCIVGRGKKITRPVRRVSIRRLGNQPSLRPITSHKHIQAASQKILVITLNGQHIRQIQRIRLASPPR